MDVATQIPHAPLRVFVMGQRAASREPATPDDVAAMRRLVRQAIKVGALGFSTSRSLNHRASDGSLTPSYPAAADELAGIALGLKDAGAGVLQVISDFDDVDAEFALIRRMIDESSRPLSMSLLQMNQAPERWREVLDRIEAAADEGVEICGQVSGRPIGTLFGFGLSRNPFMGTAGYREVVDFAATDRMVALRRIDRRARILAEFVGSTSQRDLTMSAMFANLYEFNEPLDYEPAPAASVANRADRLGVDRSEFVYDLLATGAVLYLSAANYADHSTAAIEQMLASPNTILGLGDGGAHCGLICDASLPTYMLERWSTAGRGTMPIEKVVRALSARTAGAVGLHDRGILAPGYRADLNVIDTERLTLHQPEMVHDLPHGGGRLGQPVTGYDATIVSGQVTYRGGEPTGALPGRLVRGAQNGPVSVG